MFAYGLKTIGLALVFVLTVGNLEVRSDDTLFENKIRPILVEHCYECHGSDVGQLKGGLRLDYAQAMLDGGDSGPALVPGEPDESLLIEALKYDGLEMPPSGKLPDRVIADFEEWIASGAADPRTDIPAEGVIKPSAIDLELGRQFWAFQPIVSSENPDVADSRWPENFIDYYVLAQLEQTGMAPNPDAARADLIRRLAFDLTGLPPRPQDVIAGLEADDPEWLRSYIDRLVDSRQFGEHWGRHWLDVARYADSNGSDFNATFHNAWRYRNYVIDSFNSDRPLQEFIAHQIAGDLLPAQTDQQRSEQLVATAFLMLGTKMLSERDKTKLQMDVVDEQVNAVGKAFLGMTLGCARCHDHKFDPIPTSDYYALAGIFKSTQTLEGEIQKYVSNWVRQPLPMAAEHADRLAQFETELAELNRQLKSSTERLKQLESNGEMARQLAIGIVVDDVDAEVVGEWKASTYSKEFVGQGYIHDDQKERGQKSVTFRAQLPEDGEYEVRLAFPGAAGRASNVPVHVVHADGQTELSVDQTQPGPIARLLTPIGTFHFRSDREAVVRVSNENANGYVIADAVQFVPVGLLEQANSEADETMAQQIDQANAEVAHLNEQIDKLKQAAPPPAPMALAVQDAAEVGDCQICVRGESHSLGDVVPRGALTVIDTVEPIQIEEGQSGRLELARWIADPENPLTARVYVNRIWQHLIGRGLVASADNFGRLGNRPTHPELLDRLADEFIAHGGSTKWLVRQIVTSHVYRLSSDDDPKKWHVDPDNQLLWRAHRKRLSAEQIRDAMLQSAGQLDLSVGTDPVGHLGTLISQNQADDKAYVQEVSSLRTIYLPVVRNELPTIMRVFDFADPDFVTGRRSETTVPAQALWLLNGPLVADIARQASQRIRSQFEESLSLEEQIHQVFVNVIGRPPREQESRLAMAILPTQTDDPSAAEEAWADLVHALFASSTFRMLD